MRNRNYSGGNARPQAFKRIDLFVLIAIVGVIAMLAVLSFRKASKPLPVRAGSEQPNPLRVHRLQCLANVKQLATAELMYAADNRGKFCPSYLDYDSVALTNVWMGALANYHGRTNGVWLCPSATKPTPRSYSGTADAPWTYTDRESGIETLGSYAINGYLGLGRNYKQDKGGTFRVRNVFHVKSAVRQPALAPAFCDATYWNCRLDESDAPPRNLYQPQGVVLTPGALKQVLTQFIARHGDFPASDAPRNVTSEFLPGAINMAFVDGHAETVPLEKLWTLYWHKNWNASKVPQPHASPK